ncbi:MAG: substrate-binding domain-containing protein [Dokdonella sp.]|uniref:PstS family phosphate ABC transporter substrate-binding protein n=1 Tax=Dokdonella sp. TaxID=2291710 RepID=UPI003BB183B7
MRIVLLVLCAFHVQMATSAPAGPAPATKAHPKSSKSTFVPRTTVIWRGDIVSARGFTNDLIAAYRTEQQGLLTVQPFSTISGIDAVINGSADIAGSARAMNEDREVEKALVFQPVALDAIVPVTHPRNPVSAITLAQLRQIYLGRITNWKDLGGADVAINLYSIAAPLDGVEFSFRRLMYKRGEQRIAAPRLYLNTSKLEEAIAIDPNGLGLTTLSSSYANRGIKMLAVEGISASTQSVADGSYPLFAMLYVVQREDAANRAAVDEFVRFLAAPTALNVMRRHQLIPFAEAGDVYGRDGARLAFIDTAIVGVTPADVAAMPRVREIPPPMSAPRATLEASISTSPASDTSQKARANLQRAEEKKADSANGGPPATPSN